MLVRLLILPLLLAPFLLGCSGRTNVGEFGNECSDGKDNDGDGLVDCQDSDCRNTPICGGLVDARLDGVVDSRSRPDLSRGDLPPPDQPPPATSYGQRCTNLGALCPDGKTTCVPGKYSPQGVGFCTHACSGLSSYCPPVPEGQSAQCVYSYNSQFYCTFMCRFKDLPYTCPQGFDCDEYATYQKFCWPR